MIALVLVAMITVGLIAYAALVVIYLRESRAFQRQVKAEIAELQRIGLWDERGPTWRWM